MALSQRLFLALRPGPAALHRYAEALPRLSRAAGVRWVDADRLHATLRFFGEVDDRRATATEEALAACSFGPPVALGFGDVGQFPPRGRARVLWLGLVGDLEQLRAVVAVAEAAARRAGYPAEQRPFHPHVTLARPRHAAAAAAAVAALRAGSLTSQPETIAEVVLYRSTLSPAGSRYEVLRRLPLA